MAYELEARICPLISKADSLTLCVGQDCAMYHRVNGEPFCSYRLNTIAVMNLGEMLFDVFGIEPRTEIKVKELKGEDIKKLLDSLFKGEADEKA